MMMLLYVLSLVWESGMFVLYGTVHKSRGPIMDDVDIERSSAGIHVWFSVAVVGSRVYFVIDEFLNIFKPALALYLVYF